MPVSPIPDGFHTVTPYLVVKDAAKAIEFYKKAFGAEEIVRMPGPDGKVMHAELRIGTSMVMLGDEHPDYGATGPTGEQRYASFHLYVPNADAAFKRAIDCGCTMKVPLMDMFWGDRFGKLVDPFGHHWSIATHVEDVSPEECARRAATAMSGGGCAEPK